MIFKKRINYIFIIFLTIISVHSLIQHKEKIFLYKSSFIDHIWKKSFTCKTIYGTFNIKESILIEALENQALLRMQHIDQGGPLTYFGYYPRFSRYEHCVGVWSLIRRFQGSLNEQLAGLFHDVSHTAFSHIGDNVFKNKKQHYEEHSFQDTIHLWFLENSAVNDLCKKHKINLSILNPDLPTYTMLEQNLPDMCADRIEYNLHTAYIFKLLSEEDIQNILSHLHFEEVTYYENNKKIKSKKWYFDNILHAKQFAMLPLHFIRSLWNSSCNFVFYKIFSHLIKYALEKEYLTEKEFIFGTDEKILNKLFKINDQYIISLIDALKNIFNTFEVVFDDSYDEIISGKFRGIDPLVKIDNNELAKRLTDLDRDFNYIFNQVKKETKAGQKIRYNLEILKNIK